MSDGIVTGWHHAVWLLGYLIGALPVLAALILLAASLVWLALVATVDIPHYRRVRRIRRQTRSTGRTT